MQNWNERITDLMNKRGWDIKDLRHATKLDQIALYNLIHSDTSALPQANLDNIYNLAKKADISGMIKSDQPIIIAVWAHKGGTGKSTSSINISYALARRGYNVLAIDTDSQSDLSSVLLPNYMDDPDHNFYRAFSMHDDFQYDGYIKHTDYTGLDIISGSEACEALEGTLCATPEDIRSAIWEKCLRGIRRENYYDFILIDMDKTAGMVNSYALREADYVITPLESSLFSAKSLVGLLTHLNEMSRKRTDGKVTTLLGMFYNKVDLRKRRAFEDNTRLVNQVADGKLFFTYINSDANVENSQAEHLPVCYYNPRTKASVQTERLTDEILDRIKIYRGLQ